MALYQEIILLKNFAPLETKFCIENVKPYYKPLITPDAVLSRHYFWCNFNIPVVEFIRDGKVHGDINGSETIYGFDVRDSEISIKKKALRNMVDPDLGLHILNCAERKQLPVNCGLFA
jgi:DNA (cytosine-5)-methyltransferase 1